MDDHREDEGSIALFVDQYLGRAIAELDGGAWGVDSLDIGEVEITTPGGQIFRLTVEEIEPEEDA